MGFLNGWLPQIFHMGNRKCQGCCCSFCIFVTWFGWICSCIAPQGKSRSKSGKYWECTPGVRSHQLILLVFLSENLHSIGSAPLSIDLLKFWTLICFQIEQLKFFMFLFDKMIMTKLKMWIALVLPSWYGSWQSPPYCCGRRWCTPAWGDSWRRRRWCSAPTPRPRVSPGSPAGWCRTLSIFQFRCIVRKTEI